MKAGTLSGIKTVYNSFDLDTELAKVDPVRALTSGKITTDYIGRTVYLSNSNTSCQEWIIADINHDGTSGTVDLMSKYSVGEGPYDATYPFDYNTGDMNSWLNSTLLNGFVASIRNAMRSDLLPYKKFKVTAPSTRELAFNSSVTSGNIYPIMGSRLNNGYNSDAIMKNTTGTVVKYWTRDMAGSREAYYIEANGGLYNSNSAININIYDSFAYRAIIRF